MIIVNYTPDDIHYVHGGIPGVLKSGEMDDLPESKANFLFNKYDKKGMLKLQFGDDPDVKKAQAMEIYKAFWIKQVQNHNQANEARQARNLEFSEATPEIKEHAKALNLKLLGPWTAVADESAELTQVKNENAELRVSLNQMSSQIAKLTEAMSKFGVPDALKTPEQQFPVTPPPTELEKEEKEITKEAEVALSDAEKEIKNGPDKKVVKKLKNITKAKLIEYVMDNSAPIMNEFSIPTQSYIRELWGKKCSEDWPLPI